MPTVYYSGRDATDHLAALIERYAKLGSSLRAATGEAGDADTNDLLIAFSRALDKQLRFLEAHVSHGE